MASIVELLTHHGNPGGSWRCPGCEGRSRSRAAPESTWCSGIPSSTAALREGRERERERERGERERELALRRRTHKGRCCGSSGCSMRSWPGSGGSPQVRMPAASGKRVEQGSCISVSCNELSEELQLLALRSSCPTPGLFSLSVPVLRREAVPAQVQHLQGFAPSPSWLHRTIRSACLEAAVPKHPREAGLDVHGTAGPAQPPKSERRDARGQHTSCKCARGVLRVRCCCALGPVLLSFRVWRDGWPST